jgi:hypothetical protein
LAPDTPKATKALAAEGRLIDCPACETVLTVNLTAPQSPLLTPHSEDVRINLGRFDLHLDESDIAMLRALWPSVTA